MPFRFSCFTLLIVLLSCSKKDNNPVQTEYTATVSNGYGGGIYKPGDTVHVFSQAYSPSQVFDKWTGDAGLLRSADEWHSWFIMPARNVSLTGSIKNVGTYNLSLELIRGRDRMKPVYYSFPASHKGIVYLLHGTSGTAQNLVNSYEFQLLMRDLISNQFAVVVTEAEEATTGIDANGDGKLRWGTTPYDSSTNVDYANIRIITDTIYNRGWSNRSIPRYSVGMSNGGNYSFFLSTLFKFKAGVSYCAPGNVLVAQSTNTPFQFCMARYDNNENVGPQGNADALAQYSTLSSRGICSKYLMQEHAPLYPERFARDGSIPIAKSQAVFAEMKGKGFLDARNYFIGFSSNFVNAWQANPTAFPEFNGLTLLQKLTVQQELNLSIADHQMFSDFNRATVKFLNTQCQ